jgi:hypothetical protein
MGGKVDVSLTRVGRAYEGVTFWGCVFGEDFVRSNVIWIWLDLGKIAVVRIDGEPIK